MNALREQATKEDLELKKKIMAEGPQASYGYGGKFGLQSDRWFHLTKCKTGLLWIFFFFWLQDGQKCCRTWTYWKGWKACISKRLCNWFWWKVWCTEGQVIDYHQYLNLKSIKKLPYICLEWINLLLDMIMLQKLRSMQARQTLPRVLEENLASNRIALTRYN